jgi:hypothetical protein
MGFRHKKGTFPIKADEPPSLEIPTATLAGAPPGAFLKAGASASETPPTVGTKSINISPKQTTSEFLSTDPPCSFEERSSEPPIQIKSLRINKNQGKMISNILQKVEN